MISMRGFFKMQNLYLGQWPLVHKCESLSAPVPCCKQVNCLILNNAGPPLPQPTPQTTPLDRNPLILHICDTQFSQASKDDIGPLELLCSTHTVLQYYDQNKIEFNLHLAYFKLLREFYSILYYQRTVKRKSTFLRNSPT